MDLVFIPGFMLSDDLWTDILPLISKKASPRSIALQGNSIPQMAHHVLTAAPDRFVLCGFSMGGYVAREVVRLAADRVQGLILIASSTEADSSEQRARKEAAITHVELHGFMGLSRSTITKALGPAFKQNKILVNRIQDMSKALGKAAFLAQSQAARQSDLHLLGKIHIPTLVIAADQDELRSVEESAAIADAIEGAQFEVVADSGHMIPLEQPAKLAAVINDWLLKYQVSASSSE